MAYFRDICWSFLCFISYTIKGLESTKIYVLDLPNAGDDIALLKHYDDYDTITKLAYDDRNRRQRVFKTVYPQKTAHDNAAPNVVMCQRLFGSLFRNKNQHVGCLQALKTDTRSYNYEYFEPTKKRKRPPAQYDQIVRQTDHKPFIDLTRFAQDYIDIKDLLRSEGFASDYVDVDDFKSARILPNCNEEDFNVFDDDTQVDCVPSRKSAIGRNNNNFFRRLRAKNKKSDSSSSESVEIIKSTLRHKPKRYKVISNENSDSSSDSDDTIESDENDSVPKHEDNRSLDESPIARDINKSGASDNDETESDSAKEASVEVTTKKYKTKSKKAGRIEDRYVYLQGNKVYNADDFRRGMRQSHFLPKQFRWDHDDYHKLGYYWFNGPKGEYKN